LLTAVFIAPRWKATGNLTAAEFIRERLGARVQQVYVYIFMLVSFFIKGTVLYPVARLVSGSFDLPLAPTTVVLGLLMIAYTAAGGLWAVMVTDILQFVILTAAVVILVPLSIEAAGGLSALRDKTPEDFLNLVSGDYTSGFILAFTIYHIFHIGGNWTFVQRYTSVGDERSARKVALLFAALYLVSPVIWMLPPMLYRTIEPNLSGLQTENAYLGICRTVLPPGLLGLMLTGMYFSTSASANTTLNVVSAVFTNDVYRTRIDPQASPERLMKVAKWSGWGFGLGMIGIALIVPHIGGLVNVTISVGAITGGPLLAPAIWALFSRRLTGAATLAITLSSLGVNLFAKILAPLIFDLTMSRAGEMLTGVMVPLLMLSIFEWMAGRRGDTCIEWEEYIARKSLRDRSRNETSLEELKEVRAQNRFGLQVTAWALAFTALLLLMLALFTEQGGHWLWILSCVVGGASYLPWKAARNLKPSSNIPSHGET
jgi:Na+/proline symporter